MAWSRLIRFGGYLAGCCLLVHCSEAPSPADDDDSSNSGSTAKGGTGGTPSTGGMSMGGSSNAGKGGSAGSVANGGAGGGTGGSLANGGSAGSTGGSVMNGGAGGGTGGLAPGGMGGSAGSVISAGMGGSAGSVISAGTAGMAGMAGTGPITDSMGVPLAKPGDKKTGSREFLNLGDMRILNNKWGSDELGCSGTQMSVFVNTDKSVGWQFNRPMCGGMATKPDYPEIEFGIHPFGMGSSLATSPSYSSTTLLPKQIKDITSATIKLENFAVQIQQSTTWNLNFEFWLSERNPVTDPNPGVYAELILFWGWLNGWPCAPEEGTGTVASGGKNYNLCHHRDNWADGKWRYWQFTDQSSQMSFNGTLDVKPFLEFLKSKGYSDTMWVTRFEIGTELDDNTAGSVSLKNVTFEVNGTAKSIQLAQ